VRSVRATRAAVPREQGGAAHYFAATLGSGDAHRTKCAQDHAAHLLTMRTLVELQERFGV